MLGKGVNRLFLALQLVYVRYEGAGEEHGGVAAGHCKGKVVGFRREEDGEDVVSLGPGQLALCIACDEDVGDRSCRLLYGLDCSDALRAVAGTGKGNEEHLAAGIEIEIGERKDVRRGYGTCAVEPGVEQGGLEGVSDVGGGACAGEDYLVSSRQVFVYECLDFSFTRQQKVIGCTPYGGLLPDLPVSVIIKRHWLILLIKHTNIIKMASGVSVFLEKTFQIVTNKKAQAVGTVCAFRYCAK